MLNQLTIIPGCTKFDAVMPTFSQRYSLGLHQVNISGCALSSFSEYTTAPVNVDLVNRSIEKSVSPRMLYLVQLG